MGAASAVELGGTEWQAVVLNELIFAGLGLQLLSCSKLS